ncbi:MAG: DUF2178 domain-containing protein [Spirochaetia bacterium]|nr:DUF2178 domain-containing protein [Spirochaetia bacterium]
MNESKYKIFQVIITVLAAAGVLFSVLAGSYIAAVLVVITAVLSIIMVRKQLKGVIIVDERLKNIGMRASQLSYVIFCVLGAIAGNLLILLSKNGPESFSVIGHTLAYSVCFMLLVDTIAYYWLNRYQAG